MYRLANSIVFHWFWEATIFSIDKPMWFLTLVSGLFHITSSVSVYFPFIYLSIDLLIWDRKYEQKFIFDLRWISVDWQSKIYRQFWNNQYHHHFIYIDCIFNAIFLHLNKFGRIILLVFHLIFCMLDIMIYNNEFNKMIQWSNFQCILVKIEYILPLQSN